MVEVPMLAQTRRLWCLYFLLSPSCRLTLLVFEEGAFSELPPRAQQTHKSRNPDFETVNIRMLAPCYVTFRLKYTDKTL
jgi:hypothetical protein